MNQLKRLRELILQEKQIKSEIQSIKDQCMEDYLNQEKLILEEEGIKISFVPESKSTSIDLREVQKKEPTLYKDLLDVYPKETVKKAYVKATVR